MSDSRFVDNQRLHLDATRRRRPLLVLLSAILFLGSALLYMHGARNVVPPQPDHDLEVQATGYSLLTLLKPVLLTDRHTTWYFAHPPLLHLLVAGSFVAYGEFDALKVYDDATQRAKAAMEGRDTVPVLGDTVVLSGPDLSYLTTAFDSGRYVLTPAGGGSQVRATIEQVEWGRIRDAYNRNPHLVATRTPNVFLAAVTVTLIGVWVSAFSGSIVTGAVVATAYATSPEVFVRSSYGGYFAIGAFMAVLMLLAVERWPTWPGWRRGIAPVMVGALAALADHKLVLVPLSVALWTFVAARRTRSQGLLADIGRAASQPVVVGFVAGTVAFWTYGLLLAPEAFWTDHVHHHLLDRIAHENPLGYGGYASPLGLWREFIGHTGYIVLPAAMAFLLHDLRRPLAKGRYAPTTRGLWLIWIVLTALVFTVIDWRMTKHLMPIVMPLFLAIAPPALAPPWRHHAAIIMLLVVIVWNGFTINAIAADFSSFHVTPAW